MSDESVIVSSFPYKIRLPTLHQLIFSHVSNPIKHRIFELKNLRTENTRRQLRRAKRVYLPQSVHFYEREGFLEPLQPRLHLRNLHFVISKGLIVLHPATPDYL